MNILFADQYSEPGGAQLCLMELLPEILARGWTPTLIAPGDGPLIQRAAELGICSESLPLHPCSNGHKSVTDIIRFAFDLPRMRAAIRRAVRRHRPALLYVNGPRVMPAATGLSCPVIFHAHSVVTGSAFRLLRRAIRQANPHTISISKFVAQHYPASQVIYNGVEDFASPERVFTNSPVRIGIVGRIAPEKGHTDFLRAAAQLSGATFHIFGKELFSRPGYTREVHELAAALPPGNQAEFAGWNSDVGSILRSLDILVVPSGPFEAATRVIMEAFSAGTPVVAYRSGGIPELVDHNRNGLLTDLNPEALAGAIRDLVASPALRRKLSREGRADWNARFTQPRYRRQVADAIAATAARPAPSSQ